MTDSSRYNRIYDAVRRIPEGRVATYGQIAVLADMPDQPRLVGYALHALPQHTTVPWHRVINAKGGISIGRAFPGGEIEQRFRLEAEGVRFGGNGRVDLDQFGWIPDPDPLDSDHGPV